MIYSLCGTQIYMKIIVKKNTVIYKILSLFPVIHLIHPDKTNVLMDTSKNATNRDGPPFVASSTILGSPNPTPIDSIALATPTRMLPFINDFSQFRSQSVRNKKNARL